MKIKISHVLFLLAIPFTTQCDKIIEKDPIQFGEINSNILVQEIDSVICYRGADYPKYPFYNNGTVSIALDLDSDDNTDIVISNSNSYDKWGIRSVSKFEIIDTSYTIAIMQNTDTVFSCGYKDDVSNPDWPMFDTTYYSPAFDYSCQHTKTIHSITTREYPYTYHAGEYLDSPEWLSLQQFTILKHEEYSMESDLIEYSLKKRSLLSH